MGVQRVKEYQEPEKKIKKPLEEKAKFGEEKIKEKVASQPAKKKKVFLKQRHGNKWQQARAKIEPGAKYTLAQAIDKVKEISYTKFKGNIEVHIHLHPKRGQKLRGKTEFKIDNENNLHYNLGEITQETPLLEEKFKILYDKIKKFNPVSVTLCATMSPGVKVKI